MATLPLPTVAIGGEAVGASCSIRASSWVQLAELTAQLSDAKGERTETVFHAERPDSWR